ncbi:MAG: hypothetical protein Kow0090_02440 [Myxococcota bacterium]
MYPLFHRSERTLPEDYTGIVVTCDVDKTYLDTDFESLKGLLAIPFEWAEDKLALAGMTAVLKGLRRGVGKYNAQTPFYFLTASPPFIVNTLYRKMLLDAVQCDGITCKNWKEIIAKRRKPAWLKRQLAFKLCALLFLRNRLPQAANEILIGDDTESDALAYTLYADILEGRIGEGEIADILAKEGSDSQEINEAIEGIAGIKRGVGRVLCSYIYLAKGTPPAEFKRFGKRLVTVKSAFQLAAHLYIGRFVDEKTVIETASELITRKKATKETLVEELKEGGERSIFDSVAIEKLMNKLEIRPSSFRSQAH